MEKRGNVFIKDLGWKIVSLIVAIIFWFVGMNVYDPTMLNDYNVRLTILNKDRVMENGFVLANESELESMTINVIFRGSRSSLALLSQMQSDIVASIDLSPIDISNAKDIGIPLTAMVNVTLPRGVNSSNFERVSVYPNTVSLRLDYLETVEMEIETVVSGRLDDDYTALSPIVEPSTVQISGAKTIVDTIEAARIEINLNDIDVTEGMIEYVVHADLHLVNSIGSIVSGVSTDVSDVDIRIPIRTSAQIPIQQPTITGTVLEGHEIRGVEITPKYVQVLGTKAEIEAVSTIILDEISIDNLSETTSFPYDLRGYLLDTRLIIKEGTPIEAVVTILVDQPITTEVSIDIDDITIIGDTENMTLPNEITMVLRGLESRLRLIDTESFDVSIDVTDLHVGENYVIPNLELPDGISFDEEPIVFIFVEAEEIVESAYEEVNEDEYLGEEQEDEYISEYENLEEGNYLDGEIIWD